MREKRDKTKSAARNGKDVCLRDALPFTMADYFSLIAARRHAAPRAVCLLTLITEA